MKVTSLGKVIIATKDTVEVGNLIDWPFFPFGIKFKEELLSISHVTLLPHCVPFLYPLKIYKKRRFSDIFRGYKREHWEVMG